MRNFFGISAAVRLTSALFGAIVLASSLGAAHAEEPKVLNIYN